MRSSDTQGQYGHRATAAIRQRNYRQPLVGGEQVANECLVPDQGLIE